jgi:hypothetical protein
MAGFVQTATQAAESLGMPVGSNSSSSTVTAAAGVSSGSQAQVGAALVQAVDVATGNGQVSAPPTPVTSATPVIAGTPATSPTPVAPVAPVQPAAQAVQYDTPATSTIAKPLGNTGSVIVISNIPNAAVLATAIQNSVAQTHVEVQTTISATLNSLSSLQSGAFADSLRQQILHSIGGH